MAKLLIVDDDTDFLELTARRLERAGHEVETCADARKVPPMVLQGKYDMLLLDLYMPDLNGADLLALLRNIKAFAGTRVIILSSADENEMRQTATRLHAEYVSKSAGSQELMLAVSKSFSAPVPQPQAKF